MWLTLYLSLALFSATTTNAQVTVYKQRPLAASSTTAGDAASYTGAAAYNPTVLEPPAIPDPLPNMNFDIELQSDSQGASIPQMGSFFGFSVEMSVVNQVFGRNSTFIAVPFLNLMSLIAQRGGKVMVRVGGNTQETAKYVDELPDGKMISKDIENASNPTQTPPLTYTDDLFQLMRGISDLVNVGWFLGVPFYNTDPFDLSIAQHSQRILGDALLGLQAGNEPDLYFRHGHRPEDYTPQSYVDEFGLLVDALGDDDPARHMLIGPSLANAEWQPQQVWDTGFVETYADNLAYLSVERYPTDNCYEQFGVGTYHDPQEVFSDYLNHTAGKVLAGQYLDSTAYAQGRGKGLLMFETNTASCGGFAGISDSFGAAMWALDYALQLAHANFSGVLFHVGGQNVFYNPFTPPSTNQSTFHQWTIGPVYYAALVMSEALGPSNAAQVLDLDANGGDFYTPAYAIYENGVPTRVVLFNYITDASGNSDYTANIRHDGSVRVKYLQADSVSQKGDFRWAGQTFGGHFQSDGRLQGDEDVQSVDCQDGVCGVRVLAPGVALVFLNSEDADGKEAKTYATTTYTKLVNTATVDEAVLATSNGHSGWDGRQVGSTSKGSQNAADRVSASVVALLVCVGTWLVVRLGLRL